MLGIRHHGPGSARSVAQALDELRPDLVLVEGAPELDQVVEMLADAEMRPPVAGLVYAVDEPRRALFYPLATFSPEWVAVRWALAHGVPVRFADLPVTHQLSDRPASPTRARKRPGQAPRPDPIGMLAAAAGYDDPERWWEDAVEHRSTSSLERFAAVKDAMAAVRESDQRSDDDPDVVENARREAAMRRAVREAMKTDGVDRIAFVCGAYHAPMLDPATLPVHRPRHRPPQGAPEDEGRRHVGALVLEPAGLRERVRRRGDVAGLVPAPLRPLVPRGRRRLPGHRVAGPGGARAPRPAARRLDRVGGGGVAAGHRPRRGARPALGRADRARRRGRVGAV